MVEEEYEMDPKKAFPVFWYVILLLVYVISWLATQMMQNEIILVLLNVSGFLLIVSLVLGAIARIVNSG